MENRSLPGIPKTMMKKGTELITKKSSSKKKDTDDADKTDGCR
jgi:hypothetical protein